MTRKVPPSRATYNALMDLLTGHQTTDELLTALMRRGTEHLLQAGMEAEVDDFLGRGHYARAASTPGQAHRGYRNGYQERVLRSRIGRLRVRRPRLRATKEPFESRLLSRLDTLEQRLATLAVELYTRGLSLRDIEESLLDEAGRPLLSRSAASRLTEQLYAEYEAFAERDLSECDVAYLFVDGVYESVRSYTCNQAILCAWAILADGTKQLLHLAAAHAETADAWNGFFEDMLGRGLPQPLLVITDGAPALLAAAERHFPQSRRQRCLAHKMRNITAKLPADQREAVKGRFQGVYYAPDRQTAELMATRLVDELSGVYPAAVKCFSDDLDACLSQLDFPSTHRKFIRTTNLLERAFVEEKRRTKVIPQHVNERGAIKLVFGVLIRASRRWRRVRMTEFELAQLRNLRRHMAPHTTESSTISFHLAA
jgi:putative transposase